jgi:choice-of-anchor A domain-containing protein
VAQTLTLGQAAQYGVFEVSASSGNLQTSGTTIAGNVALGNSTTYSFAGTTVKGSLSEGSGVTGHVQGGSVPNPTSQNLSTANSDAISASTMASGLKPNGSYGMITSATTFSGAAAQNVFDLKGIKIGGANITLDAKGNSSAVFVFNVSGALLMNGASIILKNGASANHVIFNVTGGNTNLSSVTFNGTILDLAWGISLSGTTLNGALLSEQQISTSGTTLNASPLAISTPEPATIATAGLGCLALLGNAALHRWKRRRSTKLPLLTS